MKYTCILKDKARRKVWKSDILQPKAGVWQYEAEINGRETCFHILAGTNTGIIYVSPITM